METITSVEELRNAINQLEYNKAVERQILKDSFNDTMDSLKPANMFKNIREALVNPSLLANIFSAVTAIGAGFVSKKIVTGSTSGSRFKKILISTALFGLTRVLIKNPEITKVFGQRLVHSFFNR
jgi:hypothetical protein